MEVGGDIVVLVFGGVEDLEDMQFFSEEIREGGGVYVVLLDFEGKGLEEIGFKDKDQLFSLLLLFQLEVLLSIFWFWSVVVFENSFMCSFESSFGGQGGDFSDEEWCSQWKYVFVLSEVGKFIYLWYGSVEVLLVIMGVMIVLVFFVQSVGDIICVIYVEDYKLVFL